MPILLDGIYAGALLGLAALGLSLSYAVFRFPNFAHGDLMTVGAYGAGAGAMLAGGGLLAAAAGAVAAAVAVMLLADRIVLRPLLARRRTAAMIIAGFAIGLVLRNGIVLLFGPDATAPARPLEIATPLLDFSVFASARLTATERLVIVGTLVLIVLLHLLLRHLRVGRALRAIAENPELAGLCGIAVARLRVLAWTLAAGFCAAAGFSLFLLGPVRPETGAEFMLPALAAVIVGGIGSIGGTLAGALLIGLVESAAAHLGLAEWRQVISFVLIVLVLCLRPAGLFGAAGVIPYLISVATLATILGIAALGLNVQFGVAGLFNVGCAGFFAAGAYATAIVTGPHWTEGLGGFGLPVPLGLIAAPAVAALLAALVAVLVLRLGGDYLAIATFGLAIVAQVAATNLPSVTGGPGGLSGIPLPLHGAPGLAGGLAWFAVCAGLAFATYAVLQRLDAAPWGRALRAVSEDPDAAAAAGKNVTRFRLQAFVIGAACTGLAGGLYAHNAGFISPQDFLPILTFQLYAMVIVGGLGRHAGALLGTAVVWLLWSGSGELLATALPPAAQNKAGAIRIIVIATVLLWTLLLRPAGLLPERIGHRQKP